VPEITRVEQAGKVAWCGCKHTCKAPFCDGSLSKLPK